MTSTDHALPIGSDVSPVTGTDPRGTAFALRELAGQWVLLVNWSPTCGFCIDLAPQLAALSSELATRKVEIVLIASGSVEDNEAVLRAAGLECRLMLAVQRDVFFGLGTPCAYLVNPDGETASHLRIGGPPIVEFARAVAASSLPAGAGPEV